MPGSRRTNSRRRRSATTWPRAPALPGRWANCMALGGGGAPALERREAVLRAAAGRQTTARTHRGAARRRPGARAGDDRRVGSADRADLPRSPAPGASIVLPRPAYPAVPVLARAWGSQVREYALRPEYGFAQTAEGVLTAVDASTRAVFVNTPHNPTGSVMPANEQRKLGGAARGARDSADRRRGVPPAVSQRADRRAPRRCPIPSCSAISPRRCPSRDCASAGSSMPTPSGARRCWICAATSRSPARRSPRRSARTCWRMRTRCWRGCESVSQRESRVAESIHARASRGAGLDAARRWHHLFPVAARRSRCAAAVRGAGAGPACSRHRAIASTCRRTSASGIGALTEGYQEALDIFRAVLAGL